MEIAQISYPADLPVSQRRQEILEAIKIRMDKLVENSERDRLAELELNQALALYENASPDKRPGIRWLIEELRVSLFAQTLGITESVSVQRIKKALT